MNRFRDPKIKFTDQNPEKLRKMPMKYTVVDTRDREGLGRFVTRTFGKVRLGLSPLWAYMGVVTVFGFYVGYKALMKSDIHLNRANPVNPLDWSRAKAQFGHQQKIAFDSADNWQPIPELAVLDELEKLEKQH